MPRTIELSASPEKIDAVLQKIQPIDGLVSISRQRGASLKPPGDVLSLQATNGASRSILSVLAEAGIPEQGSINTSAPTSLISTDNQKAIDNETNETIWDEMAFMLRNDTNPSANFLVSMALAGAIAAGGLWADKLHLIIGAMLIAPAFEPLARLPFGLISGTRQLIPSGLRSAVTGYLSLAAGAALTCWILQLAGAELSAPLPQQEWVSYWSSLTFSGVLVSVFGAIAGAIVISGQRAVLTTGVMVTLALIPSMALVGMGLATADLSLAGDGFLRWIVDVFLVVLMTGLVFWLKQFYIHKGFSLS